ncbi:hypothetical protein GCM10011374_35370 [Kocuria dechangensis]|uniref:Uncharacterized protein n=1 Tax=Kocuria dechangensis TaxID=1176249 RepID=A0A917LYX2_9MICC|nr:hypothetical protein [Kocuria dechangensis]GGG67991.1 hypothetical protein GCM10011374_35370 [Kocuria dechangensis]
MDKTPQAPAQTATTFDADALAQKLASTVTAQLVAHLKTVGLVESPVLHALVKDRMGAQLRALTGDPLAEVLEAAGAVVAAVRAAEAELLSQPRYANAPKVTGTLRLQEWIGEGDECVTTKTRIVTLPAGWLATQDRDKMQEATEGWPTDLDWIVWDLNLEGDHTGPFEFSLNNGWSADLLTEWLEATAVE